MSRARTLGVCCPDWPVVAAGEPLDVPIVAVVTGRVQAASPAARAAGIVPGVGRRDAQSRCPEVAVVERDFDVEARLFEPVVRALERFSPRIEVRAPGECYMESRGPSRYFGGDESLAALVAAAVREAVAGRGPPDRPGGALFGPLFGVGVASGPFAARLAALEAVVVPPGGTPRFLECFPVSALGHPDLADLLVRLGVRTLGDFARLPERAVADRFGLDAARAQRLARGLEDRPLDLMDPPADLAVSVELDPPVDRLDTVAFWARALARELHDGLAGSGLGCSRVLVETETEHGEHLSRLWSHEGPLGPAALAERVRWQLDAWVTGGPAASPGARPTAGITLVRLVPEEVAPLRGAQAGFWGGPVAIQERGSRALAQVQGMLGYGSVATATLTGGRGPGERVRLHPWGDQVPDEARGSRPGARRGAEGSQPWPGRVPPPAPALVHEPPLEAGLVGADGSPVKVSARGAVSTAPARVSLSGGPWSSVLDWSGPWPADERWWDPRSRKRRARMQVVAAGGVAHLVFLEHGRWMVEATYD